MNYRDCYKSGVEALRQAGIEEAVLDARLLLEHVCGTNRNDLLAHGDNEVSAENYASYVEILAKRKSRVPLQHIIGVQEFMGLPFEVNEHVLIPRQDTEVLVEKVLSELEEGSNILDMCTGSGCILTSLLYHGPNCSGVGVDICKNALRIAEKNAAAILGENKEYKFVASNLFAQVVGKFDCIVSNPPYIRTDVIEELMPEVKDHEPMLALDGKEDGLFFYRKIIEQSKDHLKDGKKLYFEIGHDQGEDVKRLMEEAGFVDVFVGKDLAGLDRIVGGKLCLIN